MKAKFPFVFVFVIIWVYGCQTNAPQHVSEPNSMSEGIEEVKPLINTDTLAEANSNQALPDSASKARRGLFQNSETAQLDVSNQPTSTIVLFFPPDAEVTEFMSQEGTPEQDILEKFELNSATFIEFAQKAGYSVQVVEQSFVTMLLKNSEIFRVKRNRQNLLCGIVLYDGKNAPRVLDGTHDAPYYVSQAKAYFGK
ncbi:MAG: hypothetical protein ACOYLH_04225 [Flavobacteriales bacterium]